MLAGVRRDQKTSADRVRLRTNQGGADRFRGRGGRGLREICAQWSAESRVEVNHRRSCHEPYCNFGEPRETKLDGSKTDGPKEAGLYCCSDIYLCSHEPLSLGGPARTQVFLTTALDWTHTGCPAAPPFPGTHLAGQNSAYTHTPRQHPTSAHV
jgi:hypothetical protein